MPTQQPKQKTGSYGEQLARNHLLAKNYTVIETNWRCPQGEIDIVAQDGDTVVFVEVRTRRAEATAAAFESVNPKKQDKLQTLAFAYVDAKQIESAWRIDVIAVALPRTGQPLVEHVEDALDW